MLALSVPGSAARSVPARAQAADVGNAANGPVVRTDRGRVRGFVTNGVSEFLGIPYAAPPVGPLRWQPPQLHARWTKTLDATSYGPTCPQVTTLGVFATPSVSEDCLYLNVFTPNPRRPRGQGLPVLVWIHGGGNVDGESNDYDGSKLATGGRYGGSNTVVVTINYRLGLLGFLANSALDSEGHLFGNYGILDQQAVLRWVQRNIAAFGGDPNRVTMGGQSAGAQDTDLNVVSPLAAGLFNGGISESAFSGQIPSLASAMSKGDAFATAAGCTGTDAAVASCLRSLTVPQILQLQGTANANGPYVNGPMVDGTVIPLTPTQAWTTGQYNHMPMMGGNVEDEANFGIGITEYFSGPPMTPVTAADYTNYVTRTYSPPAYPDGTADKVLAEYPLSNYATPQLAEDRVMTDPGACRSLYNAGLLAERVPTYDYTFNYQNAPYYFPAMPGFVPLAAHTIDIQFLFPLWHGGIFGVPHPLNAQETTLSNELVAAWTNFARTGNPNRAD
ncbi:MAG: carboxylesterase family protein, partial [Solirubrobacterales bacterium]|nr:carboxylesterase family protein [Solirubrobacterales bacterium]